MPNLYTIQTKLVMNFSGRGAWQNWSYEVSLKNTLTNERTIIKEINGSSCTVHNLAGNSKYMIRSAAYTSYGRGPWSREYIGATLLNKKEEPFILWAAAEGLLKSDPTGQSVQTMIHDDEMKNFFITNIAWYQQHIYLVTNNSQVFWYDTSTHNLKKLIDSVGSIGIDWIGKKLYWSNPKQQMVSYTWHELSYLILCLCIFIDDKRQSEWYPARTPQYFSSSKRT